MRIYPSADYAAETTLYEDDTKTVGYKDGQFRTTDIDMQCDGNALTIRIGAAQGTFGGDRACTDRLWNVRLHRNPTWGDVRSIRVNGVTQSAETVAAVTYAEKGRPFAYAGGALDGDIDTLALRTQVDKAYEIVIEYERVGHGEKNAAYDATAIDFRVRAEDCQEKNINLTALGKTDWISFGYSTGINVDYKKNGARLFTEATDVRLLLDVAAQYAATPIKGGIAKSYTDGYENNQFGHGRNQKRDRVSVRCCDHGAKAADRPVSGRRQHVGEIDGQRQSRQHPDAVFGRLRRKEFCTKSCDRGRSRHGEPVATDVFAGCLQGGRSGYGLVCRAVLRLCSLTAE